MVRRVLAWIRHGEYAQPPGVPSAHLPHGLTPRGREQARVAARAVWEFAEEHHLTIDPIIDSSRLRRAWETADTMARELKHLVSPARPLAEFRVEEFEALAERGLGAAANLTIDEIEAVLADDPRFELPARGWKRDPSYVLPLPGAESLQQAGRRVAGHVLARLRALPSAEWLKVFVGHGGAFRHAARELGLLSSEDVQRLSMQHGTPIYLEQQVDRCEGDRLVHTAGAWRRRSPAASLD